MKKLIMITFLLLSLSYILTPDVTVMAETKEIISEGTYIMGDGETPIVAEGRAIEQAKRSAVEQAGTYIKSQSSVKNFQIEQDEIEVLASGMMLISIIDKKRMLEADAVKFWVKIKAIVTPDKIDVILGRIRENGLAQEYERIKAAYDKSQAELSRLKGQMAAAKMGQGKEEITSLITAQEKEFQSSQLYTEALEDFTAGRMDEALARLTLSIANSSVSYQSYILRGFVYLKQGAFDKAVTDLNRVISMKPDAARAYAGRGICYSIQNRFTAAIADLQQALHLNPGFPQELEGMIHGHLGRSLLAEGQLREAKDHLMIACKNDNKPSCRALQSPKLRNL